MDNQSFKNKHRRKPIRWKRWNYRGFKSSIKRSCNKSGYNHFHWHRSCHDHIIRNEKDLNRTRNYVFYNPQKREFDRNNPKNLFL